MLYWCTGCESKGSLSQRVYGLLNKVAFPRPRNKSVRRARAEPRPPESDSCLLHYATLLPCYPLLGCLVIFAESFKFPEGRYPLAYWFSPYWISAETGESKLPSLPVEVPNEVLEIDERWTAPSLSRCTYTTSPAVLRRGTLVNTLRSPAFLLNLEMKLLWRSLALHGLRLTAGTMPRTTLPHCISELAVQTSHLHAHPQELDLWPSPVPRWKPAILPLLAWVPGWPHHVHQLIAQEVRVDVAPCSSFLWELTPDILFTSKNCLVLAEDKIGVYFNLIKEGHVYLPSGWVCLTI